MSYVELRKRYRTYDFPAEDKDKILLAEEEHSRFHYPDTTFVYPNNAPPFRLNETALQAHASPGGILSGDIPSDAYMVYSDNIQAYTKAYTARIAADNVTTAAGPDNAYAALQRRIKKSEDAVTKLLEGEDDEVPEYVRVSGFPNWANSQTLQPTIPVTRESFQLVDHTGVSEFDKLFNDITYVSADVESARRKKVKAVPRSREQVMVDVQKAKLQNDMREKEIRQELSRLAEQEFQNQQQRRYY